MENTSDIIRSGNLFFSIPLYREMVLLDNEGLEVIFNFINPIGVNTYSHKIDGYCIYCQKESTFSVENKQTLSAADWRGVTASSRMAYVELHCSRSECKYYFSFRIGGGKLQKCGQFPSLADIANDKSKVYRRVLSKGDASELHKAIGLAAHGVGIGSFVYLRRVFENLIWRRFEEYKEDNIWSEDDFKKMRMDEKINLLSGYLPKFMVENSKIYSILSDGIHNLSEENCLTMFEPIFRSMIIILDEDKRNKEHEEIKKSAEAALKILLSK